MDSQAQTSAVSLPRYAFRGPLADGVNQAMAAWDAARIDRLWAKDASLWTSADEGQWLGWLDIVAAMLKDAATLAQAAQSVQREGLSHVLLLGMGGSSLGPEVLARTFGRQSGWPELYVLDSTDPAQVLRFEAEVDLAKTLFVVASKSGSTLEPNIFMAYFLERAKQVLSKEKAGARFVAITDPGSKLESEAKRENFRHIFAGLPSIGGRYSVLSNFGMVPAALMGLDVASLLARTADMVAACRQRDAAKNPGVQLGVVLGAAARAGRDKLTLLASPGIASLGAWLEQLIAESTGKGGQGIIPVDLEPTVKPGSYGADRLFAYLRLESAPDAEQDAFVQSLEAGGHPVIRISVPDTHALGQQFFAWEIATAVAGSVLGIHTFNQPDVEASKIETKKLSSAYEATGSLPPETPFATFGEVRLFADPRNAQEILGEAGADRTLEGCLRAHFARLGAGDYLAFLAYIDMTAAHEATLQSLRKRAVEKKRVATCLGFGPRFLHSTGQAYKGGPASGVFLQITCDDARDLPVPGYKYSFGVVKAAQARGDFEVLAERGRRALRVHLGSDVSAGLARLAKAAEIALG